MNLTTPTQAAIDPHTCPLCGKPNHCDLAARGSHQGPCWCWEIIPSQEALKRVPPELKRKACLCKECLSGKKG